MSYSELKTRFLNKEDQSFLRIFKFVEFSENQKVQQQKRIQENFVRPTNVNENVMLEYLESMQELSATSCYQDELSHEEFTTKTEELRSLLTRTLKVAGENGNRDPEEVWECIDSMNKGIDDIATKDIDLDEYHMWEEEKQRMKEYFKKHPVKSRFIRE